MAVGVSVGVGGPETAAPCWELIPNKTTQQASRVGDNTIVTTEPDHKLLPPGPVSVRPARTTAKNNNDTAQSQDSSYGVCFSPGATSVSSEHVTFCMTTVNCLELCLQLPPQVQHCTVGV